MLLNRDPMDDWDRIAGKWEEVMVLRKFCFEHVEYKASHSIEVLIWQMESELIEERQVFGRSFGCFLRK